MSDNTTTATASIKSSKNFQNIPVAAAIDTATLLIKCRDQAGIEKAVSEFIHRYGGNIITLDQPLTKAGSTLCA